MIGSSTNRMNVPRTTPAGHDRAHGMSSCAAALRSSRPRAGAARATSRPRAGAARAASRTRRLRERSRRNCITGGGTPSCDIRYTELTRYVKGIENDGSLLRLPARVRPPTFSHDPFHPASMVTDDLRSHPVVQALKRRRDEGSRPGARTDGRRVALVIEGGGMRGVVSAGMTAAIEQLGLTDAFDEVHGASAGAFNAAFLLAGQAAYLATLYQYGFGDPRFVSVVRALRGGPAFDMDHVVNHVWTRQRPLRFEAILSSGIDLHCTATDADRAAIVDLADLHSQEEIRCALRASGRLPWLAGGPVSFRGMRLLDATLAEAIPVEVPRVSATDMLVLQTRPQGVAHTPLSPLVARLTDRYLRAINPALIELRMTRSPR